VAVSGLCGAGKSTAARLLAKATGGEMIYFGATVLSAVRERGLSETSANEQIVRIELRDRHGPAYLAVLETERIKSVFAEGRDVLVDAIYCGEELEYLSRLSVDLSLIGIEASFSTRLARLGVRAVRPMTEPQLRERDAVDLMRLKTGNVVAEASVRISNNNSMEEFESALSGALSETSVSRGLSGIDRARSNC
jgi:dephospho-CoA kinase